MWNLTCTLEHKRSQSVRKGFIRCTISTKSHSRGNTVVAAVGWLLVGDAWKVGGMDRWCTENLCEIKTCCCLTMQCRMNTQERTAVWTVGLGVMVWRCRLIVYNKWTTPGRDLGNWAGCAYSAAGACVFSAQFFSWSQTKIEWCLCAKVFTNSNETLQANLTYYRAK